MKKIFLGLLAISILSFGVVDFASATSQQYKDALAPVRRAKNAQVRVINKQIDTIKDKIEADEANANLSDAQRSKNLKKYNSEIQKLKQKKSAIQKKYNAQKKQLKAKYK